ncbi:MAG: FHA domain-containing protein, partial [Candidatus Phosphoribacter sp.]
PALTHANEFTQVRTPAPVPPVIAVGGDDELIIDVPWRTGSSAPAAPSPPVTAPLGRSSPVPAASPSEAPVGPAATVSGQAVLIGQAGDVEEHTVLAPGLFMPETATLASGERGVELAGDAGDRIAVDGALLLGRNPAHLSGFETARLVALVDATMSVSKTHAALGPDPDGLWLEDLHSTNGTFVTTPGGVRQAVLPGGRVTVQAGSTVHLGKRSFVVGLR